MDSHDLESIGHQARLYEPGNVADVDDEMNTLAIFGCPSRYAGGTRWLRYRAVLKGDELNLCEVGYILIVKRQKRSQPRNRKAGQKSVRTGLVVIASCNPPPKASTASAKDTSFHVVERCGRLR